MERYVGKVAIVTGASSGIGEACADRLVKDGMLVVGLARRFDRMQKNAEHLAKSGTKGKLFAIKCDIRIEEDILRAFEWTTKNVGNVQVLINNAGLVGNASLADGDTEVMRAVLETNVLGQCIAAKAAIQIMRANKIEGHIININSICGHKVIYFQNVGLYGATKFGMTSFTDILRQEMVEEKSNIKVTSISPGPVRTEMLSTTSLSQKASDMFHAMTVLESEDIADTVVYVLSVPKHVQINELTVRPLNAVL